MLTAGALGGYGVEDRDQVTLSNTPGTFLVHPVIGELARGASAEIGWTLFWHSGCDDFFAQALRRSPQMLVVDASHWTSVAGHRSTFRWPVNSGPRQRFVRVAG